MSDPFARIREKRAARAAARPAPRSPGDAPLQTYKVVMTNRGWASAGMLLWTPVVLGLILLFAINEHQLRFPYDTGVKVVGFFLLVGSIGLPAIAATSRRDWRLFADRLEIRQRPIFPPFGVWRRAVLPFGDIAVARMGEVLNGAAMFEVQAKSGDRHRLMARHIGTMRNVQVDHAGFEAFIDSIRQTILASGAPMPAGQELRLFTSGATGVVILGVIAGLFGAGALAGAWLLLQGEPIGMQTLAFTVPFVLLFSGLFLARWRKWRSGG